MANTITLTGLIPSLYAAKDQVARELTGVISSSTINSSPVNNLALGMTVTSFISPQPTLRTSYTPSMVVPDGDDQTLTPTALTLDQVASVSIPITGEDVLRMNAGVGMENILSSQFKQAMRVITNQIEKFTALALKNGASRAVGTAGTTPFATDFKILPSLRKVLVDNGCPVEDGELALVLNSTAGANLRGLAQLNRVNEAGGDQMLRRGELLNLNGFSLKESAGIPQHVAGTGANYVTSGTGAIGDKSLTLATGTGTILAGDIVSVANSDGSLYVVNSPIAAPGVLGIAAPGLTGATATAKAVTVGAGYTGNVGFHKSAVEIVMRPPAMPPGGDIAVDRTTIFDAVSGLVFEVAEYKGRGMNLFEITTFYGAKVWKPEYVATLLG